MADRFVPDRRALDNLPGDPMMDNAVDDAARAIYLSIIQRCSRSLMGWQGRTTWRERDQDAEGRYGKVAPNDPGWHLLEYGTAELPATRQLQRAVEATGARYVDGGA